MSKANCRNGVRQDFEVFKGETWQAELPVTDILGNDVPLDDAAVTCIAMMDTLIISMGLGTGLSVSGSKVIIDTPVTMAKGAWKYEMKVAKPGSPAAIIWGWVNSFDWIP